MGCICAYIMLTGLYREPSSIEIDTSTQWLVIFFRNICDLLCHSDADGVNLVAWCSTFDACDNNRMVCGISLTYWHPFEAWNGAATLTERHSTDKTGLNCHTMRMNCAKSLNTLHWIRYVAFFFHLHQNIIIWCDSLQEHHLFHELHAPSKWTWKCESPRLIVVSIHSIRISMMFLLWTTTVLISIQMPPTQQIILAAHH